MTATLEIQSAPELGPGIRRIIGDCDNATTTGLFMPSPTGAPTAEQVTSLVLLSHELAERCGCALALVGAV